MFVHAIYNLFMFLGWVQVWLPEQRRFRPKVSVFPSASLVFVSLVIAPDAHVLYYERTLLDGRKPFHSQSQSVAVTITSCGVATAGAFSNSKRGRSAGVRVCLCSTADRVLRSAVASKLRSKCCWTWRRELLVLFWRDVADKPLDHNDNRRKICVVNT